MKKLLISFLFIITALTVLTAGKPQDDAKPSRSEKKAAKREIVKSAIESKSFAVEFERLYMYRYGMVNLIPRSNFIVIDGDKAYVSAAYMGRQRGFMPIAGIKLSGQPSYYKMEKNTSKGTYTIEMEVKGDNDIFHIRIIISENGNCNTTISANMIDSVKYTGSLIPRKKKTKVPEPDAIRI
ncbi:MAG TPA: DUF4251 domain-containing protein [Bacteroidales bacterium]|nr:DUF4251 domain-containing protein [Bacteroidales bacterium]